MYKSFYVLSLFKFLIASFLGVMSLSNLMKVCR